MKLGVCTSFDNIEIAAQAGFEFIECNLSSLHAMSDEDYEALLAKSANFSIPVLKCNGFLPSTVPVSGPGHDTNQLKAYLEKALSRAHALGIKTAVFGSGGARKVPEGWSHFRAWQQIADFLRLASEYAEKYDIDIAIEPLRRKECNILNLVSEALAVSSIIDTPRVGVLGDSFHMNSCHEPWSCLTNTGDRLIHFHISHTLPDFSGRIYPKVDDGEDYEIIIHTLLNMNYQGDISVEASTNDFYVDAFIAAEYLRRYL
ncbi:MAG: sugar phosphate isomerase/epimerase [Lachnospiraceae bacterium]|nr:sugar phosphate isomerase/epimerase [Lachnospiraceae bacterium]